MMMLKIAFRNIFRQKRRTILTMLTMFGGFTLAAFSIGWADGSYNFIINMFTRNQLGHVQIHAENYRERPSLYKTIDNYLKVGKQVREIGEVEAWAPRLYSAGLLSAGDKSTGGRIIGIDPQRESAALDFDRQVTRGQYFSGMDAWEALLGKGLAEVLKADVGDSVVVVSQGADGSIANDIYRIAGIVESGNQMNDRLSFYLPLHTAQRLLVLENRVHEIAVVVQHLKSVPAVT
ncbi:MAG: ABC transporter permease, partial [Calditrichia bacterium]